MKKKLITRIRFLISICRLIIRKYSLSNERLLLLKEFETFSLKELETLISGGTRLTARRVFISDSLLHRLDAITKRGNAVTKISFLCTTKSLAWLRCREY